MLKYFLKQKNPFRKQTQRNGNIIISFNCSTTIFFKKSAPFFSSHTTLTFYNLPSRSVNLLPKKGPVLLPHLFMYFVFSVFGFAIQL